jgi:hypothetical protein
MFCRGFHDLLLLLYKIPVHFLFLSEEHSVSLKIEISAAAGFFRKVVHVTFIKKMKKITTLKVGHNSSLDLL